jgi:hypothetical protein
MVNMRFDPAVGLAMALIYERLPVEDVYAAPSFYCMARDEREQFDALALEVIVEPWPHAGQPYCDSRAMRQDVLNRAHLYVFTGGSPHPYRDAGETYRGRAVHDAYGHAWPGHDFSPDGELRAFVAHAAMYSKEALPALATDNLGQTAYYYFHPRNVGKPHAERAWPEQKMALLPEALWRDYLA